jgi:nuclease S1
VALLADVHQPLHAGYMDDRGGNNYQLQAFMRGSNLYAVWDTGLIKSLNLENTAIVKSLQIRPLPNPRLAFTAAQAAQDSCRIVGKAGFHPDRLVTPAYIEEYTPVMLNQLALAGARLAEVMNQATKK